MSMQSCRSLVRWAMAMCLAIGAFGATARADESLDRLLAQAMTDNPEVANQVVTNLIATAKALTGKDDPIEAVAAARADPAIMQQVQESALDTLDRLAPLLDKMAQWDKQEFDDREAARTSARRGNAEDPFIIDFPWLRFKFIHLLSIAMVSFSGWFVTTNWSSLTAELKGAYAIGVVSVDMPNRLICARSGCC